MYLVYGFVIVIEKVLVFRVEIFLWVRSRVWKMSMIIFRKVMIGGLNSVVLIFVLVGCEDDFVMLGSLIVESIKVKVFVVVSRSLFLGCFLIFLMIWYLL